MKTEKILKSAVAAAAAITLTGCGSSSTPQTETIDAQTEFGCSTINIYNWGEYMGEDVIPNFEKTYNAKVNYDMFDSNENMYTRLLGGSSYDLLVPSDYMIERLLKEDLLQPLDKEALTNLGNLDPEAVEMQKVYDPDLAYSVPYFRGSVGFVYNKNNISEAELEEKGWNILLDEKLDNKVFMYDSQRDAFMVAFKALGYSMNTDNEEEIEAAYEWLRKVHQTVHPAYVTDEVIDAMAYPNPNEAKDIAVVYSGDAAYILSVNEDMGYFEPKQGTNIWSDGMVIPKNAGCPALANEFINFVLEYDSSYDNSITVGYTSTNLQVKEDIANGEYAGINAYLPRSGYDKDEVFRYNDVLVQKLSERWTKVKLD